MQIQVRVSEEGALRNQRHAFTDRYTLASELLQNARRAGAVRIDIDYDPTTRRLRIRDNGRGIEDFQKLLDFNESGWDEATKKHEHPFGVGFSKCLYAAQRCIVRSGDCYVDFLTADALARKPIDVHLEPHGPFPGTLVELYGVDLPDLPELREHMRSLCIGFPVEVIFNGGSLDRPYAANRLESVDTTVGAVHLAGTLSGKHSTETMVFLQGFRVLSPRAYSPAHVNIVHLDPERFIARLPDRHTLIEERDQAKRVNAEIRHQWRAVLEVAKFQLPPRQFVDRYTGAMRAFGHLDLLNDLDVLPRGVCARISGYPIQTTDSVYHFLDEDIEPPTRQDIDDGRVVLVDLDNVDDGNAAHWMFARAKGFLAVDPYMLHEGHWIYGRIRKLCDQTLGLEPVETQERARFEGCWTAADLVLCAAVRLRIGEEAVDVVDDAVHHGGTVFVPGGETTGQAVRQLSDYVDGNDQFRDYEEAADIDAFADLVRRLRSVDPRQTLTSLLRELKLERYPVLRGKAFRLIVDGQADAHSIELIG